MPKQEKTIAISELKAKLLSVIDDVNTRGQSILVTKRGKPVATINPLTSTKIKPTAGQLIGTILSEDDIVSPLGAEIWDATSK